MLYPVELRAQDWYGEEGSNLRRLDQNQVCCQLHHPRRSFAWAEGLEPPTNGFGDRRSAKLSYAHSMAGEPGLEPGTSGLEADVFPITTILP